jgi:hypothetical protein
MMPPPPSRRRRPRQKDVTTSYAAVNRAPRRREKVRRVGFYERTQPPFHSEPIHCRGSELELVVEFVGRKIVDSDTNLSDPATGIVTVLSTMETQSIIIGIFLREF